MPRQVAFPSSEAGKGLDQDCIRSCPLLALVSLHFRSSFICIVRFGISYSDEQALGTRTEVRSTLSTTAGRSETTEVRAMLLTWDT